MLVIDAADNVAKTNPVFFNDLQDFAKVCADAGSLRIIFVSSEGAALPLMHLSSAWSRMLKPPYEVPDIGSEEAVAFLVRRGLDRSRAVEAVRDITGGRFSLLHHPLFRELCTSKITTINAAIALLSRDKIDALLKANILAAHPDGTYTTHARHVEVFLCDAVGVLTEVKHGHE